uniref:ATP synthase complex subunit 8 n=1 Tax=Hydroptila sp. XG-2021 TaxID=2996735 RepID=A0A9E8LNX4_9NEOP|nr:ATP synthase F0 subunit 8 [Hydroptila sp. XG-2021]
MPQMAPTNWLILFLLFIVIMLIFNIMNYFNMFNLQTSSQSHFKSQLHKPLWKW